MSNYFNDREHGPPPRIQQEISPVVWGGLVAIVNACVNNGALGFSFPERCPGGHVACGTDEVNLAANVQAEMSGLNWPLKTEELDNESYLSTTTPYMPPTLLVLDFMEYVHARVAKPSNREYHSYYRHHHLAFDQYQGQAEFREAVNSVFARNCVAFELQSDGRMIRLHSLVLGEILARTSFRTGNQILDVLLEEARAKFSSPNPIIRREALERLWDAWERLKSMADPDKRKSIGLILDKASGEPTFRQLLEDEATELTKLGNSRLIRHYEVSQVPVIDSDHVDYLFHRLFALIHLLLRKWS